MAGDRRALLIATSSYSDPGLRQLRSPAGDVESLAKVLSDPDIGNFDVLERMVDRTTDEIRQRIEALFEDAQRNDVLLLYLSGHGVMSKTQRLYFATKTTKLRLLRATAIDDSFVNDLMKHSRARSVVLVLDCCHSGAFGKDLAMKGGVSVPVAERFEGQGRIVLTASTALEYAFEETEGPSTPRELGEPLPSSLFTRYFIKGLETGEADLDKDGMIALDELYDYVYERVRERSRAQTPSRTSSGHGEIVIARSRYRPTIPDDVQTAINVLNHPWAVLRESAVGELARIRSTTDAALTAVIDDALRRVLDDDSRRVAGAAQRALEVAETPVVDPMAAPTPAYPTIAADETPAADVQKQLAAERLMRITTIRADDESRSSGSESARRASTVSSRKTRANRSLRTHPAPATQAKVIARKTEFASSTRRAKRLAQRVRELNERIIGAAQSDQASLGAYEMVVKTVASTIKRDSAVSELDWICHLADVQAKFIVRVVNAWADQARHLLEERAAKPRAVRMEQLAPRIGNLTERIIEAAQRSDYDSLATYEMVVKAIATTISRDPAASDVEFIASLAVTRAQFIVSMTDAWTSAAQRSAGPR